MTTDLLTIQPTTWLCQRVENYENTEDMSRTELLENLQKRWGDWRPDSSEYAVLDKMLVEKFYVAQRIVLVHYVGDPTPWLIKNCESLEETDFSNGHFGMQFQGCHDLHLFTSDEEKQWTRADVIERKEFLTLVNQIMRCYSILNDAENMFFRNLLNLLYARVLSGDFTSPENYTPVEIVDEPARAEARKKLVERCEELGLQPEAVFIPNTSGVFGGVKIFLGFNKKEENNDRG